MKNVDRVLFVGNSGTSRAPMAAAIFASSPLNGNIVAEARGMVVQFPEPMNQKAEAVLISNGIEVKDFASRQLEESDFTVGTVIICMEESQRQKVLSSFEGANEENTVLLNTLIGDELEIMDPYGAPIQTYGLCFEVLKASIEKLMKILKDS